MKMPETRKCWRCGGVINSHKSSAAKFCSSKCGSKRHWESVRSKSKAKGSNLGAESELYVSADLLRRGFEVYRNVSSWGSSDLIFKAGVRLFSVEVRTGYVNKSGNAVVSKERMKSDILAVVTDGPTILYKPELPKDGEKSL
jgi:hypothetical protein